MRGPGTMPAHPRLVGFSSLPTCGIIQTSHLYPLLRTSIHLILLQLQSCLPQPLVVHSVPECSLHTALCGAVPSSPGLWVYVTTKLLLISSVQCQVPSAQRSPSLWGGNLSLNSGLTGGDKSSLLMWFLAYSHHHFLFTFFLILSQFHSRSLLNPWSF